MLALISKHTALQGDASKARLQLGWAPRTRFTELVGEMVDADIRRAERDVLMQSKGFDAPSYHEHE